MHATNAQHFSFHALENVKIINLCTISIITRNTFRTFYRSLSLVVHIDEACLCPL